MITTSRQILITGVSLDINLNKVILNNQLKLELQGLTSGNTYQFVIKRDKLQNESTNTGNSKNGG
jgi:hypothetical protein